MAGQNWNVAAFLLGIVCTNLSWLTEEEGKMKILKMLCSSLCGPSSFESLSNSGHCMIRTFLFCIMSDLFWRTCLATI